jgi:2-methylisocitrate lyase-like PEP mutase family enzyme
MSPQTLARTLKALHKPGSPVILANVYDILSAQTVASLPSSKALATASYAITAARGTTDDDLDLNTNLAAIQDILAVSNKFDKPVTVDIQDGYGDSLDKAIAAFIDHGVVGVNLEDCDKKGKLYSPEVAIERTKRLCSLQRTSVFQTSLSMLVAMC